MRPEQTPKKSLEQLQFDNVYLDLPAEFYDYRSPVALKNPRLLSVSESAAELLELRPDQWRRSDWVALLGGERLLAGMAPAAMCYAGHQFGHYVPRLGDGRALLLGQVKTSRGARWDLHLKGSGPTLYSRGGDGRAVLRSSIREYLCSEAMHGLGIATTRALCLIGSDEPVYRERCESAAMVVRVAQSHIRFGSFEYCYYNGQHDSLRRLADYVIDHHYPELAAAENRFEALLLRVAERTAALIAQWQGVGFAHGVMNSDNMSILGLTLDYGPFGFLDTYEAGHQCNQSDHQGRYAFHKQPEIGLFNISCLAQAMVPLLSNDKKEAVARATSSFDTYRTAYQRQHEAVIRAKLGLLDARAGDVALWDSLLALMEKRVDFTRFFRALSRFDRHDSGGNRALQEMFGDGEGFDSWAKAYARRLAQEQSDDEARCRRMNRVNPKYVLRNHLAEAAIRQAEDEADSSEVNRLLALLRRPYDEQPALAHYADSPPPSARSVTVSCSS